VTEHPTITSPSAAISSTIQRGDLRRKPAQHSCIATASPETATGQPVFLRNAAVLDTPVAIETVTPDVFKLVTTMLEGFSEHCAFFGTPAQVSATVPVLAANPASCNVKVAVWPLVMTEEADPVTARLKSAPNPESTTARGALRFDVETVSVPVAAPSAAGENVTSI